MSGSDPKIVDAGKAEAVDGVETAATAEERIEAGRREAKDARLQQLIQKQLSMFFATQETPMLPAAAAGEEDAILGGNESGAGLGFLRTKTSRFGVGPWHNDHDLDGGGSIRGNLKNTRQARETPPPRINLARGVTKD
eukprot:jgi/Tetstr1/444819/TSEL_032661.t1